MINIRVVSAEDLRAKIRFEDLIDAVSRAFQDASAGLAENGLIVLYPADRPELGDVYVKTGVLRGHKVYIVKVSPWFAINVARGRAQGGFIAVFDSTTGQTLALLNDEHYLSDIRTASAGALAARLFAPAHVETAAVLGAGVQAYWQTKALYRERPFEKLLIWARDLQKAEHLRSQLAETLPEIEIGVSRDIECTVHSAEVLITATMARDPLVCGDWLREGQHITAVGADDPTKCELDAKALNRARVFVDSRETAVANGDIYRAIQQRAYAVGDISGEIGDVLLGKNAGRTSNREITIAKLVGLGAQDLVAAERALELLDLPRQAETP